MTAPLRFLKADTAENVELFAHGGIIKENLVERRDVGLKSLGQADVEKVQKANHAAEKLQGRVGPGLQGRLAP